MLATNVLPSIGSVPSWISAPDPNIYLTGTYCVFDFETTTEATGFAALPSNHIVSTCWKLSTTGETKFVYGSEEELIKTSFCKDLMSVDFLVGQNIKFEIQWLIRLGLKIQDFIYYDTSIGMAVQLGNREKRGKCNLDSLARAYILPFQKPPISKYMEFFPPAVWPISWVQRYNSYDVRVTELIFLKQRHCLADAGLLPTFYAKCLFTPVVAEMEYVGMHFDTDVVLQYCKQLRQQQMLLKAHWAELCPGVSVTSSKQIGSLLYDELKLVPIKDYKGNTITTKTKKLPTGSGIILQLKPVDERSKKVLEIYKELKTITSLFSKVWKVLEGAAKEGKSILYFSLNQTITATHRLSSTKRQGVVSLQGQNLPRKYSPIFCSRHKDWLFGEIDFAQFEFRAGVSLANDQQGIIDIQDPNFDIHVFSANQIFKLGLSKFDKKQIPSALRTESKKESFGPMYGKTSGSPAQKAYQQAWKERYKELYAMQEGWCWKVLADKKLTLPTGMIFYWPNVSIDEGYGGKTYIRPKTEIYNHPIQYFATSEGSTAGIVSLWHRMKSLNTKSFLVNTKHDSVEMEIHPEEKELMEVLSMEAFEKDVAKLFQSLYNYTWLVSLASEMTIEKWWNGRPKNCGCNPLINCEH